MRELSLSLDCRLIDRFARGFFPTIGLACAVVGNPCHQIPTNVACSCIPVLLLGPLFPGGFVSDPATLDPLVPLAPSSASGAMQIAATIGNASEWFPGWPRSRF